MDNDNLQQLKTALSASPDNIALLEVVLHMLVDRNAIDEAKTILQAYPLASFSTEEQCLLAAKIYLQANELEHALEFSQGEGAEILLCQAKILLALDRLGEGHESYLRAIAQNPTLEDPSLAAQLSAKITEIRREDKPVRLRVISNDDTDANDVVKLIEPDQEPISFQDVGGLAEIKKTIHKKIILPYQKPSLYQRFRKRVGGGILLYGAPGCGKTLLARATAGECKASFFSVAISDILDMYIGESERKLHALFETAREQAPSVLFFDEIEAIGGKRQYSRESTSSKLVSQLLSEMDGFAQNNRGVLILAATNVPWSVDPAFRRPGRFDRVLFVPPPDREARCAILNLLIKDRPVEGKIDISFLSKHTQGFSGADLNEIIETAVDQAIEQSVDRGDEVPLCNEHFKQALKEVKPTTQDWLTTARNYARYANESGQYNEVLAFLQKFGKS